MINGKMSFKAQINSIIQQRQFYWWLGHVFTVCNGLLYFSSVLSLNTNHSYYKRAYLGTLLSYAMVIYDSVETTHISFGMDFLCDENVHYFVIAFYWYSYQSITVTLIPFFVFSIFHTLSYPKDTISLIFNNDSISSKNETVSLLKQFNKQIQHFIDNYHTTAMNFVSYIEVVIISTRIIFGILIFHDSILALIVFVHFLRLRYYLSNYTREALKHTTFYLDKSFVVESASNKKSSIIVSNIYLSLKRLISRYGGITAANNDPTVTHPSVEKQDI